MPNPIDLIILTIAAVMVYGARFIVLRVFQFPEEAAFKPLVALKIAGILVALIGVFRIFGMI